MAMSPRAAALLRVVHDRPGVTRADAARAVGIGSGAATEVVAQLCAAGLVKESPAEPTGARGRPTTVLGPHPDGPLVLAASLTSESWLLRAVGLGGGVAASLEQGHAGRPADEVLVEIGEAVARLRRRFPHRVRGLAVAAAGIVSGTSIVHAAGRTWRDVDLRAIWPRAEVFVVGNDATLAAAAESARGAAVGAEVALHIRVQAGIGGAVVDQGRVLTGAHGFGGEFGHMPLGEPGVPCPCGATGCWGTAVDGTALARRLGRGAPKDPVAYAHRLAGAARKGDAAAREALTASAVALGTGLAGIVNALDPDAVTVGGSALDLLDVAGDALDDAYRGGLMRARRDGAPGVIPAILGEDGPLLGAEELAWQEVWPRL